MIGLLRFRLWEEKITVSRQTIYSSISLFFMGAILLGLGLFITIGKYFNFVFDYFETFLIVFTIIFLAILVFSSGKMRKRITNYVNTRLYKNKYDYQEQFFRLHETHISDKSIQQSVTTLLDNLIYTLAIDNAYIFIKSNNDGNYYIHKNPNDTHKSNHWLSGDSHILSIFSEEKSHLSPIDIKMILVQDEKFHSEIKIINSLGISFIFPIKHDNTILGLLAFRGLTGYLLDTEDKKLISVFATSIANILFKNKILNQHIEHKQFESFNHIATFIIHDIKNQVATLSLLSKNAKNNIDNPKFQKSLLYSLDNCTNNLQTLIKKFSLHPKEETITTTNENIDAIITETIKKTAIETNKDITLQLDLNISTTYVNADKDSLYYVFLNIITNAREAMNHKGKLSISSWKINRNNVKYLSDFSISEQFISSKNIAIIFKDTGKGMTKKFIEQKLFHPFSSTKDKGIGIGLYQCKTLIEKQGGKIICHSKIDKGTQFCILL